MCRPGSTSIFQPFHQGRNIADHAPGSGIGLALVAQFASLHGGRAWVQDRPGGGASFRVFLPHRPPPAVPSSQAAPMRWLLVLGLAGLAACSSGADAPRAERALPEPITVSSPAFTEGAAIPQRFT